MAFGSDIRIWRKKVENFDSLVNFVENSFEQLKEDFLITYEVTTFAACFFVGNNVVGSLFLEIWDKIKKNFLGWLAYPQKARQRICSCNCFSSSLK